MEDVISSVYNKLNSNKSAIILNEANDEPKSWESKFGGKPYMLESDFYPVSFDEGEPYEFLLQINLSELPSNDKFPKQGILQFYLNHNFNFDKNDKPFLIRYYQDVTFDESKIDLDLDDEFDFNEYEDEDDLIEDADNNDQIIEKEYKIEFELVKDEINPSSYEWQDFSVELRKELEPYKYELVDFHKIVSCDGYIRDLSFIFENEDVEEIMYANKLLGYPANPQTDIRTLDDKFKDYILLLQLSPDTEAFDNDDESTIEWFIHPDDLKNGDFSKVICSYYYDGE